MYVLEENLETVREAEGETPGTPGIDTSVIEPLVIRANEGDTVEIEFVNSLGQHPERDFEERPASIHPTGVAYEVDNADGKKVGFNENTVVESGESITYRWHADQQGAYFFQDGAYQAWDSTLGENPERVNSMARGLFGALVVEPPGSTWTDPCTGAPLRSGVRANIHNPDIPDHREFVPVYHDHNIILPDLVVPGTDDFIQTLTISTTEPSRRANGLARLVAHWARSTVRGSLGTPVAATTSLRPTKATRSSSSSSAQTTRKTTSTTSTNTAGIRSHLRKIAALETPRILGWKRYLNSTSPLPPASAHSIRIRPASRRSQSAQAGTTTVSVTCSFTATCSPTTARG